MQAAAEMLDQRLSERTGAPETQNIRGKWENIKKRFRALPLQLQPTTAHFTSMHSADVRDSMLVYVQ